ncbi:hypothetical protein [Amycolatopsis cihanbeyliensis]|uniref:Uncharacterized protein n=1 Tax=Amycolatopsis cihanbeyliensis TaxID=1128664 RepID=A0A542DQS0_AMYCI|nr:hypothetical protein [Amycolatopsis cihanbeyliensis]TQJ05453.1 hypothetical protein FB471_5284 [Amycolatopsis cihanbeyliensis]
MRDIPVNLNGFKLMVTEAPVMKMQEKDGQMAPVTDREGVAKFVVSLFAKRRTRPGEFAQKGEEIKVTLASDPGEGFEEGVYVELINGCLNSYQMETEDGRTISGISFKAEGLKPAGQAEVPSAA